MIQNHGEAAIEHCSTEIVTVEMNEGVTYDSPADTQPISSQPFHSQVDTPPDRKPWGLLVCLRSQNESIPLIKKELHVGRGGSLCQVDYKFTEDIMGKSCCLSLSRLHFIVTQEKTLEDIEMTYITDLSSNGTFVNGNLIGKGNRRNLWHNDTISVGFASCKVFRFYETEKRDCLGLPVEVTNNYVPIKSLGQGGYGQVFLTVKRGTGCREALKVIPTEEKYHILNPFTEPDIMFRLNHENIVKIQNLQVLKNTFFLFLEYVPGGNLFQYVSKREFLQENVAKNIFRQLMKGIDYLHLNNIVHRDIKPLNILVSDNTDFPTLKITDFGLSRKLQQHITNLHTRCGTKSFSPPEMLNTSVKHFDHRWDIWSAGVVLYYCISGRLPFQQSLVVPIETAICERPVTFLPPPRWKNYSRTAVPLIRAMLKKNWNERPDSRAVLNDPWLLDKRLEPVKYGRPNCQMKRPNSENFPPIYAKHLKKL